ncbi:hypothetical protein [Reinekea thalattae]|uniref:Uncharacterized protein n=1 Tax=Reinekea thalattae TaxID=2593301 RepID=A0A5C8Z976_9GAMM|nr:hypothetical protein [Reinekea thalattae]TXR53793.1 hypothetical protein FME95_04340 [Reinekea thalattae]
MTTGSWEPGAPTSKPSEALLLSAAQYVNAEQFGDAPAAEVAGLQSHMQMNREHWSAVLETLDSDTLKKLARFFTLAESHWADWFGGDKNPTIWVCKELKARGEFPDKELTAWIKANTENRFLPYGNVLG